MDAVYGNRPATKPHSGGYNGRQRDVVELSESASDQLDPASPKITQTDTSSSSIEVESTPGSGSEDGKPTKNPDGKEKKVRVKVGNK